MPKVIMEKGTYYIGDPGYINSKEPGFIWIEKLWDKHYNHNDGSGMVLVDGVKLFIQNTYDGDGKFGDFFCDTGTFCVMKIDDLFNDERFNFKGMNIRGAKFVSFPNNFEVTCINGDFNINNEIFIKTSF